MASGRAGGECQGRDFIGTSVATDNTDILDGHGLCLLQPYQGGRHTTHLYVQEGNMTDKPKVCMLCGCEIDTGSICAACSEGVKREALGKQANLKQQAEREARRQGVNPEEPTRTPKP